MIKMRSVRKLAAILILCVIGSGMIRAQELPLPVKDGGFEPMVPLPEAPSPTFLKPTVSIKPPASATPVAPAALKNGQGMTAEQQLLMAKAASLAAQRAKDQAAAVSVKRIVVMKGPLSKKLEKSEMLPANPDGRPVTLVGIDAPKDVVLGLESFFGVQLTPDNEKKLLETVSKGMAGASHQDRKVEVLGWWPKEGVMAVGVHPEG